MTNLHAGIDIGSTTSKAVVMNEDCTEILGSAVEYTSFDRNQSGEIVLGRAVEEAGVAVDDIATIGVTGYGRRSFARATHVSPEVICHGVGTEFFFPGVRTIIDVGGQDSKVLMCYKGRVERFEMNDKCAAGTGRFFEVLSNRLICTSLDDLGVLALKSKDPVRLSSVCTIFAESEIVSLLSQGVKAEDICKGVLLSVEKRIIQMARQSALEFIEPIVLSGGFSRNVAAASTFESLLQKKVETVSNPQLPASVGVAIIASGKE